MKHLLFAIAFLLNDFAVSQVSIKYETDFVVAFEKAKISNKNILIFKINDDIEEKSNSISEDKIFAKRILAECLAKNKEILELLSDPDQSGRLNKSNTLLLYRAKINKQLFDFEKQIGINSPETPYSPYIVELSTDSIIQLYFDLLSIEGEDKKLENIIIEKKEEQRKRIMEKRNLEIKFKNKTISQEELSKLINKRKELNIGLAPYLNYYVVKGWKMDVNIIEGLLNDDVTLKDTALLYLLSIDIKNFDNMDDEAKEKLGQLIISKALIIMTKSQFIQDRTKDTADFEKLISFSSPISSPTEMLSQKLSFYTKINDTLKVILNCTLIAETALKELNNFAENASLLTILNDAAWYTYLYSNNASDLIKAKGWSYKSFESKKSPQFIDTYAHLCFALGDIENAIKFQTEAIFIAKKTQDFNQTELRNLESALEYFIKR